MANNSISLVNLDFDTLKNQLKTYLKGQAQFSDYDFDGSNMSILLDVMTYNTHLNAFYLNMVASEMFIDSAQLRNSVVSIAKALNYTPRSARSSKAVLNLKFAQSGLSSFSIPLGTRFTGKNSNGSYSFITDESMILYPANGFFTANGVSVYEGSLITDTFVVDYSVEGQRFIMTNDTIDTSALSVVVSEDSGQTNTDFSPATNLFGLTSSSNAYFVQATEDTRYEIVFGDGVFGRRPKDGSIVYATYRITSGTKGNGATNFILNTNLGTINSYGSAIIPTITVVSPGFGGASAESIEEIRFRAPKAFQTQQRAITTNDYAALIMQRFPDVKSAYIYGGETVLENPQYGKVYISPLTYTGERLSSFQKSEIESFVKERAALGINPVVLDNDYLYLMVMTVAKYSPSRTQDSLSTIESKIKQTIQDYSANQLEDFDVQFESSRLEAAIDDSDPSIISNQTDIIMKKVALLDLDSATFPVVRFRNAIVPGSFYSSEFTAGGRKYQYTDYNPNNNTFEILQQNNEVTVINDSPVIYLKDITVPASISYSTAGTIDYATGSASMSSIVISDFIGKDGIEFFAKSVSEDIVATQNDVITIDTESISVTVRAA